MERVLKIADLTLALCGGFDGTPINSFYAPFWKSRPPSPSDIKVRSVECDAALMSLPIIPEAPCSFEWLRRNLNIVRRNILGVPIWSVKCCDDLHSFDVRFEETTFWNHYESIQDLVCKDLGLLLLSLNLSKRDGLIIHGSATVINGVAVLCMGKSGAGKSTIAHILNGRGASVLTDERPIIRFTEPNRDAAPACRVHGSPWASVGGFTLNESAPLKRLYFLEHGLENEVRPLCSREAVARLAEVTTLLWDVPDMLDTQFKTVEALLANVPAAVLSFRPDEEVVDVIRRDLATEREII